MAQRPSLWKSSPLLSRFLSASVLIPVSLYMIYAGPPFSLLLGGLATVLIFGEWSVLYLKCSFSFLPKLFYGLGGFIYLSISTSWFLLNLRHSEGWILSFWIFFLVWTGDIGAYGGGKLLKGPKLAPSISPNKTWSGFFSGVLLSTVVGYAISLWLIPSFFSLLGIFCLALGAQGGDLLESQAKRWSHVKDSSNLIPGHGGVLDRLDSLLAVSFILALWQFFV